MNRKSKEFLDLQKEWYDKLKESGFKDDERDEVNLNNRSALQNVLLLDPRTVAAKEEYYRLAGHFLYDYRFNDDREKVIWELHADGLSIVDIVESMKDRGFKVYKSLVHKTLQRLAQEMGTKCKKRI